MLPSCSKSLRDLRLSSLAVGLFYPITTATTFPPRSSSHDIIHPRAAYRLFERTTLAALEKPVSSLPRRQTGFRPSDHPISKYRSGSHWTPRIPATLGAQYCGTCILQRLCFSATESKISVSYKVFLTRCLKSNSRGYQRTSASSIFFAGLDCRGLAHRSLPSWISPSFSSRGTQSLPSRTGVLRRFRGRARPRLLGKQHPIRENPTRQSINHQRESTLYHHLNQL